MLGYVLMMWLFFFFFKQKTAYELRISDWSSDVCSSDLPGAKPVALRQPDQPAGRRARTPSRTMIMRTVKFWQRLRGSEQIMVAAAAGLVLFLLWASIARVDEVSRGQGRVIPSSKVQIIQSSEPSTIDRKSTRLNSSH